MSIGPEFDVFVARALGWKIITHDKEPGRVLGGLPPSAKEDAPFVPIPAFSTSMTAAWAIVVRKLKRFEMTQVGEGEKTRWICQSDGNDAVVATTAPVAICLCYLKQQKIPFRTANPCQLENSHTRPQLLQSLSSTFGL